MDNEKKLSPVSDVGAWAMNVVSSVGIIMANKQLMSSHGYAFSFGYSLFLSLSLSEYFSLVFFFYFSDVLDLRSPTPFLAFPSRSSWFSRPGMFLVLIYFSLSLFINEKLNTMTIPFISFSTLLTLDLLFVCLFWSVACFFQLNFNLFAT